MTTPDPDQDLEASFPQDLELESPNFSPKELEDFRSREFDRKNRWV